MTPSYHTVPPRIVDECRRMLVHRTHPPTLATALAVEWVAFRMAEGVVGWAPGQGNLIAGPEGVEPERYAKVGALVARFRSRAEDLVFDLRCEDAA